MIRKQLLAQLTVVNKLSFNNTFDALALLQDQSEKLTKAVLDQTPWLTPESRKAADAWAQHFKRGRQSLKQQVNDGCEQFEKLFPSNTDDGAPNS